MNLTRILFFIMMSVCTTFAQTNTTADKTTLATLKKFRADFIKAMTDGTPELIHSYYGDNIRLMTETQLTMMGKANALHYYKAFNSRFDVVDYTRTEIEVLDLGARVLEFGTFTTKLKMKSTGKDHELQGKYLNIWEHATDGKMLLVTEVWNYNHRVDIAQQLVFPEVPTVNVALQAHVTVKDNISFELAALNHFQETVISQHDAKLWSMYYADDYVLFRVGNPIIKGRKEIDAWLDAHVKELPIFEKLDIRNDHIDNLGEYVIEYASHTAIVRNGEWSGVATGKDIRVWRRERDGSLKIIRGIGAYD